MTDIAEQLERMADFSKSKGCTAWLGHGEKLMRKAARHIRKLEDRCRRQDDACGAMSVGDRPERSPRSTNESGIGLFDAPIAEERDGE